MEYKENVLDRIEQSFGVLTSNFLKLVLPVVIFYVGVYYVFYVIGVLLLWFLDTTTLITPMNYNIWIWILLLGITYLIAEIAIVLSLYKTIKDIDEWNNFSLLENYTYGMKKIFASFVTYFYIFMYVYFLPAILFIAGGLYVLYLQFNGGLWFENGQMYSMIWIWLLVFSFFVFYVIYRSNKTVFALVSAVSKNEYSKDNFNASVALTKWKWWRIFGNFFLVGLLIGIISMILSSIVWSSNNFWFWPWADFSFWDFIEKLQSETFSIQAILTGLLWRFIVSITIVFIFIFTYIFYKRLQVESTTQTPEITQGDIV